MSIYQTLFCFICTHLTSGEKDGDELKRNADVHEILRRTRFHSLSAMGLPKSIHDHEWVYFNIGLCELVVIYSSITLVVEIVTFWLFVIYHEKFLQVTWNVGTWKAKEINALLFHYLLPDHASWHLNKLWFHLVVMFSICFSVLELNQKLHLDAKANSVFLKKK